jgi:hypothetical protein
MGDAGLSTSEPIIAEVLRVLRERFQTTDEYLMEAREQMNTVARKVADRSRGCNKGRSDG